MDIFFLLVAKILPFYVMMAAGFIAGRKLNVDRDSVAAILIYLLGPVVFFCATAQMKIEKEYLLLPFGLFVFASTLGVLFFKISGYIWKDGRRNLVGYMMGTANQGYFGIPVFLALFGEGNLGLYIFIGLGFTLYESTIGYYLMARGNYSVRESLAKLVRFPVLPAALLGLGFSALDMQLPTFALDFYNITKGAYTFLGMMLIGVGLSSLRHLRSDLKFTSFTFLGKFVFWPAATLVVLWGLDHVMTVNPAVHNIFVIMSIMPLAANTVAFATHLKLQPEKAATVVMLTTFFALFYIPLMVTLLMR